MRAAQPSFIDPPFLAPIECVIELPVPPTVNSVRRRHGMGSRRRDAWFAQADVAIMAGGGLRKFAKMPAACEVLITVDEKARIDLDGVTKYLIDWARRVGLIVDDDKRYVRRVTLEWGDVPKGCRLLLRSIA